LTFGDVRTTDHSLNLFRTLAVLAEISLPEKSIWSKSDVSPSAPESFTQSVPLGTWRKTALTESIPESVSSETLTTDEVKVETEVAEPLRFSLSPNRPKVNVKTVLSLQPADSGEHWTMTLDLTGNITSGELKSLYLRWDERCKAIQSIEPFTASSFEQTGEQQTLVLSPAEPMRGEQKFKIVVSLDTSGTTVVLPNVFPLARGIDQLDAELVVDLPRLQGGELIPWDLKLLEAEESQTADDSRLRFRAVDTDFRAAINQVESRLTAVFYDIGFLIKQEGTMIGVVTIDLRNRGQDSFILQMPQGYEPIQISSAGLLLDRTRLAENNRWKINIGANNYPQRLSILFRSSLPQSLKQWNREQMAVMIQFPLLEGVAVQETIWTVVFEGDAPTLNVASALDRHWGSGKMPLSNLFGNEIDEMGEHSPLSRGEAAFSLVGLNLIRKHNLLRILNSLPVPASVRKEEMQNWFAHWSEEWNTVVDKVDFQMTHLPLTSQNIKPKFIVRPTDLAAGREETTGVVRSSLETMSLKTGDALKVHKERSVQEKFGAAADMVSTQPIPILNSHVYWQGRISSEMRYLFGAEEGALRAVRFTSLPEEAPWTHRFADHVWLWIGLMLLLPILVLLAVRWVHWMELWLQFPHFWGMIAGVLLWTFVPTSLIGLILIVLTFVSLFRPSWSRHRSISKPF